MRILKNGTIKLNREDLKEYYIMAQAREMSVDIFLQILDICKTENNTIPVYYTVNKFIAPGGVYSI